MGLLGTAAKAYVATRVVGATHRRQQQRWAAQEEIVTSGASTTVAEEAVAAPAPGVNTMIEQLQQLGQLRDAGILTDAEFETQKQRILAAR